MKRTRMFYYPPHSMMPVEIKHPWRGPMIALGAVFISLMVAWALFT